MTLPARFCMRQCSGEKALKETILRVKQNSIREHSKHLDPTDMAGLQKIIADKKQLEKLEKTNISIP